MISLKAFIIVLVLHITIAEDVKNITEAVGSPRLAQDSYVAALANSRKGALSKADNTPVIYVTAATQGSKVQTISKPIVHITQPIVPIAQPIAKIVPKLTVVNMEPTIATPIRREDSQYDTGPNAEPYSYNAYSSNDAYSQNQQYSGNTGSGYDNSYQDSYLPQSDKYGAPSKGAYGAPSYKQPHVKHTYGTPDYNYGAPSNSYGPPAPMYGVPMKHSYGMPYGMTSFFDKFSLKMDLVTIAKILLKIIIFKKIVKFIAVICMLMFIPKLLHKKKPKDDYDDEERGLFSTDSQAKTNQNLNILTAFVQQAIDTYSLQQKGCEDVGCRIKRVLDHTDDEYTLSRMADMFNNRDS